MAQASGSRAPSGAERAPRWVLTLREAFSEVLGLLPEIRSRMGSQRLSLADDAGQSVRTDLSRRQVWRSLNSTVAAQGGKLSAYSFRHT